MGIEHRTLYVLADGARARFVERRAEPGSYATFEEIDARDQLRTLRRELRANPRARNQQSGAPALTHTLGRGAPVREAKQAFIENVADRASTLLRNGRYAQVVVAAPDRLLDPLSRRLAHSGAALVAINRDLTKTPDHALGDCFARV
jgi:hypothetical protein